MSQPVIPLSYMVRQAEARTAEVIGNWLNNVMGGDFVGDWSADEWTRSNHIFKSRRNNILTNVPDYHWAIRFLWSGGFVAPDDGDAWSYGPTQITSQTDVDRPNHTYLYDNRKGIEAVDWSLSETVAYAQSRSTETATRTKLDIGLKTGITIGGEKQGGSWESEIQTNFGIESDSKEADAENTSRSETQTASSKVKGGHATLATLATPDVRTRQGSVVQGLLDGGLRITFPLNAITEGQLAKIISVPGQHEYDTYPPGVTADYDAPGHPITLHFDSFDDLNSLANGYNVDYPCVTGPLVPDQINDHLDNARSVKWEGVILRDRETSAAYVFTNVDAGSVDEVIAQHSIPSHRVLTPA